MKRSGTWTIIYPLLDYGPLFADVSDDHFWLMSDPLTYAQANKAHASYFFE